MLSIVRSLPPLPQPSGLRLPPEAAERRRRVGAFRGERIPRRPRGHIARSLRGQTARGSGCGRASPTMRPEVPRQGKPAAAAYPPSLSPASFRRYTLERVGNQLEGRERRTRPTGLWQPRGSESRAQSRSTAASLSMFTPRDRRLEPGSDTSQIKAAEEHPSRGSCPSSYSTAYASCAVTTPGASRSLS